MNEIAKEVPAVMTVKFFKGTETVAFENADALAAVRVGRVHRTAMRALRAYHAGKRAEHLKRQEELLAERDEEAVAAQAEKVEAERVARMVERGQTGQAARKPEIVEGRAPRRAPPDVDAGSLDRRSGIRKALEIARQKLTNETE